MHSSNHIEHQRKIISHAQDTTALQHSIFYLPYIGY